MKSKLTLGLSVWKYWGNTVVIFSSVQFSHSVVSDSLRPHGPQHARPPRPSPTPGVYPNSCPLSWWCHPTISSSVTLFSSRPQSFWASGSFQMSQFSASGGQSIEVSASASVLPVNNQDRWSPLGWIRWISLQSKGLSRVFSNTTVQPQPLIKKFLSKVMKEWMQKFKIVLMLYREWREEGNWECVILHHAASQR